MSEPVLAADDNAHVVEETRGLWVDAWADLRRRPRFWIAAALIVVLLVIVYLVANLVVDLLYAVVDPRVRY